MRWKSVEGVSSGHLDLPRAVLIHIDDPFGKEAELAGGDACGESSAVAWMSQFPVIVPRAQANSINSGRRGCQRD